MIRGQVNAQRQAIIPISVQGHDGSSVPIEAMIDTGFSVFLSLPRSQIAALALTHLETRAYIVGDNRTVDFDLYLAVVIWEGQERDVLVLATDGMPLIGMSLLRGHRLFLDIVDGGEVIIEARS